MDIELAIVNLQDIVDIVDSAKTISTQINETANLIKTAEDAFSAQGLSKAVVKKLVSDIKSSGVPLNQVEFKLTGKNVSVATGTGNLPADKKAAVVSALSPLMTKDITASAAEPAKRIELASLKAQAKTRGLSNSSFDKVVKNAVANTNQFSKYVMISNDGFLMSVSEPLNWTGSGGSTGGGSGGGAGGSGGSTGGSQETQGIGVHNYTQEISNMSVSQSQSFLNGSDIRVSSIEQILPIDENKPVVMVCAFLKPDGSVMSMGGTKIVISSSTYFGNYFVFAFGQGVSVGNLLSMLIDPSTGGIGSKIAVTGFYNAKTSTGKIAVPVDGQSTVIEVTQALIDNINSGNGSGSNTTGPLQTVSGSERIRAQIRITNGDGTFSFTNSDADVFYMGQTYLRATIAFNRELSEQDNININIVVDDGTGNYVQVIPSEPWQTMYNAGMFSAVFLVPFDHNDQTTANYKVQITGNNGETIYQEIPFSAERMAV